MEGDKKYEKSSNCENQMLKQKKKRKPKACEKSFLFLVLLTLSEVWFMEWNIASTQSVHSREVVVSYKESLSKSGFVLMNVNYE